MKQKNEISLEKLWSLHMSLIFSLFFIMALLIFGASIRYDFSILDDPYLITNNIFAHGFSVRNIVYVFTHFDPELYIPLTFLSWQANYTVGGLDASIYHFTNIVLHTLNATLVYWLALTLTHRKKGALIAALFFLLHPLNTEAVVWIAGRKDLLATFCILLSVVQFFLFIESTKIAHNMWSIFFFACALLSKSSVILFPFTLIVLDSLWQRQSSLIENVREKFPYIILSLIAGAIAMYGKLRLLHDSPLFKTLLLAGKSSVFYLQKFFIPINLTPLYPYTHQLSIFTPDLAISWGILLALFILLVISLKRTRWIVGTCLISLLLIAPSFSNAHKGSVWFFAVDRYVYLPMIPILLLGIECMMATLETQKRTVRHVSVTVLCVILLLCGSLSQRQTKTWSTNETMLTHALKLYPNSIPARTSLASIYQAERKLTEAQTIIEEGMKLKPRTIAYHTSLGSILLAKGNAEGAEQEYRLAQDIDKNNPEPLFFLGSLRESQGKIDEALTLYRKALILDSSYVAAATNAGGIEFDRGNYSEAESLLKHALEWNPNSIEARYNLYQTLSSLKRHDEALRHLQIAFELNEENLDISFALGYKYYEAKKYKEAKNVLQTLLQHHPNHSGSKRLLLLME